MEWSCREIVNWVAAHQTPSSRALAAQSPAVRGAIITCWKARGEEGLALASSQQKQSTTPTACSGVSPTETARLSTAGLVPMAPQTFDAHGRPLFLSIRNFHFDMSPIMEALHG